MRLSAGKRVSDRRCTSWPCSTCSSPSLRWCWWSSHAGPHLILQKLCRVSCVVKSHDACVCVRMLVDNLSNKLVQKLGRQEFVVPANVLVLVYGQTVVWTGALFCPLLPLINTVKFIILFYCKKVNTCHTHTHTHHSALFGLTPAVPCSLTLCSLLRSRSSVIADRRWEPFDPPPLPSSSWWSSCLVGVWPQLWWPTVLLREHLPSKDR